MLNNWNTLKTLWNTKDAINGYILFLSLIKDLWFTSTYVQDSVFGMACSHHCVSEYSSSFDKNPPLYIRKT